MKTKIGLQIKKILFDMSSWLIILSILLAIIYSMSQTYYSDFNAINGDFQNYNPARRLLDGQIPYKDFPVYLGCGELFLNAIGLLIMGNTFTNSLRVMYILGIVILWLTIYIISNIVSGSKKYGILLATVVTIVNLWRPGFVINNIDQNIWNGLNLALAPGNSARLVRGFIIILVSMLCSFTVRMIGKSQHTGNKKLLYLSFVIGAIAGGGICWSNDYGISAAISLSLIYASVGIKISDHKVKTILINAVVYGIGVLSGVIFILSCITRGNIKSYFLYTFSVSSYQQWYFEKSIDLKPYYIYEIDYSVWIILAFLLSFYYYVKLWREKDLNRIKKNALLSFVFLTSFLGEELYHLISGGYASEFMMIILFAYIISVCFMKWRDILKGRKIHVAICLIGYAYLGQMMGGLMEQSAVEDERIYIGGSIDGYLSETLADSITLAAEKLGENEVFSTYASAVETYLGKFQPTGADYIIHALGDKNRQKYMEEFRSGDYKYVTTINENYSLWEHWIKNANWFFYRELYANYRPILDNYYQMIWEKNVSENRTEFNLELSEINIDKTEDGKYRISIQCSEPISGIADVRIGYMTEFKKSFWKTGAIKKMVFVESTSASQYQEDRDDEWFNFFLPEKAEEYYIPITVIDGYGESILTAVPEKEVKLTISDIGVENIFISAFEYSSVSNLTDENWKNGILKDENVLLIPNTSINKKRLENAVCIVSKEGTIFNIIGLDYDPNWINIWINAEGKDIKELEYPNIFTILQNKRKQMQKIGGK